VVLEVEEEPDLIATNDYLLYQTVKQWLVSQITAEKAEEDEVVVGWLQGGEGKSKAEAWLGELRKESAKKQATAAFQV